MQLQTWIQSLTKDVEKWEHDKAEREAKFEAALNQKRKRAEESIQHERRLFAIEVDKKKKKLQEAKEAFEKEKIAMAQLYKHQESVATLDIGGVQYKTSIINLTKYPGYFQAMFSGRYPLKKDSNGAIFIDRDGSLFKYILNFLRDGNLPEGIPVPDLKRLLKEADYFQLDELMNLITQQL